MPKVFRVLLYAFLLTGLGVRAIASDVDHVKIPRDPLVKSMHDSFGSMRGSYLGPGWLVADQIFLSMGAPEGAPGATKKLPDGNYLLAGSRPHSATEKSAIIATRDGTVQAAALVHFHCRLLRRGGETCDDNPNLTLFLKPDSDRATLSRELEDWAKSVSPISKIDTRMIH